MLLEAMEEDLLQPETTEPHSVSLGNMGHELSVCVERSWEHSRGPTDHGRRTHRSAEPQVYGDGDCMYVYTIVCVYV